MTLRNQSSVHEEIKGRLKRGNVCYHSVPNVFYRSVPNVLSSSLLSKNIKIKVYRTVLLSVVFVWVWNLVFHIEGRT